MPDARWNQTVAWVVPQDGRTKITLMRPDFDTLTLLRALPVSRVRARELLGSNGIPYGSPE